MDTATIMAISSIVVSVGGTALAVINHTRIRSVCCGKKIEMSVDIEKTTPPPDKLKIQIPE